MDLVDCDDISEASILGEIEKRFQRNEIYSSIGPILIAMNPYKSIAGLYGPENLNFFTESSRNYSYDTHQISSMVMRDKPHVWMVPFSAYQQLRFEHAPQAIVISGESGAGKTETTKLCLQLLSSLAMTDEVAVHGSTIQNGMEDRILATNPVLESFGNAKTARNNNSSRFGKWIQIDYSKNMNDDYDYDNNDYRPLLTGARITQYLLEKSRVVVHGPDERNYHIFYQLCASGIMGIQPAASYRLLRFSKNLKIPGVDDKLEFKATCDSMSALGFTGNRGIDNILTILLI
jgi:myosin heavy subunit